MSAQVSPILSSQVTTDSTIADISQTIHRPNTETHKPTETNSSTESPKAPEAIIEATSTNPQTSAVVNNGTVNTDLDDIKPLHQAILIDEHFDLNLLEAPSAGNQDTIEIAPQQSDGLGSNFLIEPMDSQINFHTSGSSEQPTTTATLNIPLGDSSENILTASHEENSLLTNIPDSLGSGLGNVTEDFKVSLEGKIDTNFQFSASSHSTQFGNISYNKQGDWHYQLDNQSDAVQSLGAGSVLNDAIELVSISGARYTLNITINGSNDQAIVSGDKIDTIQTLSNTEQTAIEQNGGTVSIQTAGHLSITDNDMGEARFLTDSNIPSTYGSASVTAQGQWNYTLDPDQSSVKGLTAGEQLTDYFSIKTIDGSSQLIQITINGSDDKPYLGGGNLANLELNATQHVEGALTINDPDFGQSHFQENTAIKTNFGVGSIDASGHWKYNVDSSNTEVQHLAKGEKLIDTFTVHTADGTEQTIIIPIGNNAFATTASSNLVSEHATPSNGQLQFTDILVDTAQDAVLEQVFSEPAISQSHTTSASFDSLGLASGTSDSDMLQQIIHQTNTDIV